MVLAGYVHLARLLLFRRLLRMAGLGMKRDPWFSKQRTAQILDAVEDWADGYIMIRETGCVLDNGRLDALLVPYQWQTPIMQRRYDPRRRFGLIGVEVKATRADFQRGLKRNQFQKYADKLDGLYVAAPMNIIKKGELPLGIGRLVINDQKWPKYKCVCRQHPLWQDRTYDENHMWKLIFTLVRTIKTTTYLNDQKQRQAAKKLGEIVGAKLIAPIEQIMVSIEKEMEI